MATLSYQSSSSSSSPSPSSSLAISEDSVMRRISRIAVNFASGDKSTEEDLTDDALKSVGRSLLKDYVRDRLFRGDIVPSDAAWHFFEEDNNNNNGAKSRSTSSTGNANPDDPSVRPSLRRRASRRSRLCPRRSSFQKSQSLGDGVGGDRKTRSGAKVGESEKGRSEGNAEKTPSSPPPPSDPNPPKPLDSIRLHLRKFCLYLERRHAHLYREVSRQLNVTMSSQAVVDEAFNHVADQVLGVDDSEETTPPSSQMWSRIASLFVLTGSFCLDCVAQGHSDFLSDVVAIAADAIFRPEVTAWMRGVGGWTDLVDAASGNKRSTDRSHYILVLGFGFVFGFFITILSSYGFSSN